MCPSVTGYETGISSITRNAAECATQLAVGADAGEPTSESTVFPGETSPSTNFWRNFDSRSGTLSPRSRVHGAETGRPDGGAVALRSPIMGARARHGAPGHDTRQSGALRVHRTFLKDKFLRSRHFASEARKQTIVSRVIRHVDVSDPAEGSGPAFL